MSPIVVLFAALFFLVGVITGAELQVRADRAWRQKMLRRERLAATRYEKETRRLESK